MKDKMLILIAAFLIAGLCYTEAFALSPMGAPTAGLSKGQFGIGVDYADTELAIDFDFSSGTAAMPDFSKTAFRIDSIGGKVGYGISDIWEVSVNVGNADAVSSQHGERHTTDGLAYGIGTKLSVHEDDKIEWGGLIQARWLDLDGDASGPGWTGDVEFEIMQLQLAIGPTYELMDSVCVYGGPFWYYLDGEKEYDEPDGWYEEYDMSNDSEFGGYIGLQVSLCENSGVNIEYQITDDDDALGVSVAWRF